MSETAELLRSYLAEHPRPERADRAVLARVRVDPAEAHRSTGRRRRARSGHSGGGVATSAKARARWQANALAELTVAEAEARLVLDWASRCGTRPSIRPCTAQRCCGPPGLSPAAKLSPYQVVPFPASHLRELVPCCRHPPHRHRRAHGPPRRQDHAHCLRPPHQY